MNKNVFFIFLLFAFTNGVYAVRYKKNSYTKLKSNEFERLKRDAKDLKKSFNSTRVGIKKRRNTIGDMRGFIEICKNGAQDHCQQARILRKQKSEGVLSIKKKWRMRKLKKGTRKIEKQAAKMLAMHQACEID